MYNTLLEDEIATFNRHKVPLFPTDLDYLIMKLSKTNADRMRLLETVMNGNILPLPAMS